MRRRIEADFPRQVDQVTRSLAELTDHLCPDEPGDSIDVERIQVSALVLAQRDLRRLGKALELGRTDWRDLLVAAGLADEGWQELVEAELVAEPAPHIWTTRHRRPPA